MKGKSYLSLGGVSMGIAGSIVDHNFFESWLGMKVQAVDMTELRRRIDQKIYDEAELEMALAWADKNFRYGEDENNKQYQRNAEQSRAVLRESLLMAMCIRDMMQGNSKLTRYWSRGRITWLQRHRCRLPGATSLDRSISQWRYR